MKCIDIFLDYLEKIPKTFNSYISVITPLENGELLHNYLHLDSHGFPNAEHISHSTISVLVYPFLTDVEIEVIEKSIDNIYRA